MKNEGIVVTEKRGRGRPRTGRVLWARRVDPEMVEGLEAVLAGVVIAAPVGGSREVEDLRASNKKLLEAVAANDAVVARKDAEIAELTERLDRAARASDDARVRHWTKKYDDLKQAWDAKFGASEWAQ